MQEVLYIVVESGMVSRELLNNSSVRQLQLALDLILWHTIVCYRKLQNTIVCYGLPHYTTAY